ncbi:MAG: thiamine pyrophosphate-binding protein, partial [Bdellovibrionia bacterium]
HSIRQTQQNYFPDNVVGCGLESGLAFPDFEKIANAFEIPFRRISNHSELTQGIGAVIGAEGPQICEVLLDLAQQFAPKLSSRKLPDGRMISCPLEDLAPFLPREEFLSNLLINPVEEKI